MRRHSVLAKAGETWESRQKAKSVTNYTKEGEKEKYYETSKVS